MAEILPRRGADSWPVPLLLLAVLHHVTAQHVNRAPHFVPQVGDMSHFTLAEDTPVGTPVYQLKGIDPENDQLRYSISGQHLSVDALSGVVTLVRSLDREELDQLEVIISITDEARESSEPNTVSLRRVIPVTDVNDNPPVFLNRPYIVNISEAAPVGAELQINPKILVTDRDAGLNANLLVTCSTREKGSDAEACATFRVETVVLSSSEYEVRLFVDAALDYERRSAYVVTLQAADASESPLRAAASVAVAVRDEQDQPPVFLNAPYSATVPENTPTNTSILEIIAKDGDTANPRAVLLTIEGDTEGYFKLVPEKPLGRGVLVTSDNPIDRESETVLQNGGVYTFFIKATELINNEVPSDYTVTSITIIVTDVDDHAPRFNKDVFDISIPENIENGSPIPGLSIYVEDDDIGQNSKYDLKLRDVLNSRDVFAVTTEHGEGRTPITIKVTDSSRLDYDVDSDEGRLFSLDIVSLLNDVELSAARVNIKLLDVNDNAPVFERATYKFDTLENTTIGSKVGDVAATDKDFGIFGELEYTLTGFGSNLFNTDKQRGGLYVQQELDYEKQKSYSLTLFAKDGGGKSSSTSIFIDVLDVNDNAPIFEATEYTRTIRDGATSFEPQLVLRAIDVDGPTQGNGRIKYSIESDNSINNKGRAFEIDEDTGELSIVDKLDSMDTPRGQYELIIRATDYGIPALHNDTRVYIRVGVPGNQRPTFKGNYHLYKHTGNNQTLDNTNEYSFDLNPMNYKATIKENAKPGDTVTKVTASDPDGLDALLVYSIVSGSKDNFVIHEKSGLITVSSDANLDRDVSPERYELVVSAVDSGTPLPETATTTVLVLVQDVNDKPPKFNFTESSTYISEKTKVGDVVAKIVAFDTDVSSKLKYSIVKPMRALSKAGVQLQPNSPYDYANLFHIEEDTGEIRVNGTLDYNQASIVILTVKVIDVNAEIDKDKQFATIDHTIYIQPYADKNPQFTNPGWSTSRPLIYHKIKEDQPIGSTVLVLAAEDPVSGHLVSNYKVINSETELLQVDPLTGQVVLTKHLDYEELTSPNLTLTVKATSSDGARHSEAKIVIEVININDNPPIFEKEVYRVSVLESVKHPEHIVSVKANDADAVLTEQDKLEGYSDIRYALRGENSELFTINNVTGAIQIGADKHLDRERQSVLRVLVEASDVPRGGALRRTAAALLLIDVLDVDDNAPAFDKSLYTAVVPENVPVGMGVINVTATDPDEGLGGEIRYEFLDEGEAAGLFSIEPRSGWVHTSGALTGRGRTAPYRLLVGATDAGGHAADASLAVYIGDVSANDGVPRFIRPAPGELLTVNENTAPGTVVYEVVATDPDDPTQPSGQLHYYIQQSDDLTPAFTIERRTGVLRTRGALDRERRAEYALVVVAEDAGRPPLRATALLRLAVADLDDHKPHFARNLDDPPVVMLVQEEVPIGTEIGRLRAIDEDIEENAAIDYAIISGNELGAVRAERTTSNEARLVAAARLDREQLDRLLITLKCFKHGTTPTLTDAYNRLDPSHIQVLIKVEDLDDNIPEFVGGNVTVGVRLNVAPHTAVVTLRAADADPGAAPLRYLLAAASFQSPIQEKSLSNVSDVFSLDNVTGELKIVQNLIHYADGIFRLRVLACNSDEADRCGQVWVEVTVVRERELLRLEGAGWSRRRLGDLQAALDAVLAPRALRLQLHLHDAAAHTHLGPCFQLRSVETGSAQTARAMLATLRALDADVRRVLEQYSVRNVTRCGPAPAPPRAAHTALLALAAALPLAALLTAVTLCCMHDAAKKSSRKDLVGVAPSRLYSEPLYSS